MIRARWLSLLMPLLFTGAAPTGTAVSLSGPVFVDESGVHSANLVIQNVCDSLTTLTLTIHRSTGDDVRVVTVKNIMVPDLCGIACLDCPVPFAWSMSNVNEDVAIEGGGTAGFATAYTMQGPFQEGILEFRGTGTRIIID